MSEKVFGWYRFGGKRATFMTAESHGDVLKLLDLAGEELACKHWRECYQRPRMSNYICSDCDVQLMPEKE